MKAVKTTDKNNIIRNGVSERRWTEHFDDKLVQRKKENSIHKGTNDNRQERRHFNKASRNRS